jgi:hypothetical protein
MAGETPDDIVRGLLLSEQELLLGAAATIDPLATM